MEHASFLSTLPHRMYVDGVWSDAEHGTTFAVRDPATGGELARVPDAAPADGIRALDAAVGAADAWAATSPRARSVILQRVFALLQERKQEVALLMTLEMGKPLAQALGEVDYGSEFLRWFAEEAVRIDGRHLRNPAGTGSILVTNRPVGPCFLITPWNFPLAMATRKIAPALAAGCTVVVKPAELTPLTTLYLAALFEEAGLPPGVLNVVTTTRSAEVSAPIIADPRLRKLSFTGSTAVGTMLLAQAAQNVLRTSMELGGNAPFIVFDDADVEEAVQGAMLAKYRNIGQACTAANRFYVHASVAAEFEDRIAELTGALVVGNGATVGVDIGPLIEDRAVERTTRLVQDALERGARLVTGGTPLEGAGSFFAPTVLADVPADSAILREEIFGPVVALVTFETEEEVVRLANDTEYGLVSYVYTRDLRRAHRLIDSLATGMMAVNSGVLSDAAAPFGGVKRSGIGREGGAEGIREYLSSKYTLLPA